MKSVQFSWSQDCQKAFDTLKEKLSSPPVLAYPKDKGEYILDTDASNHAIGAVQLSLLQVELCVGDSKITVQVNGNY